MGRSAKTGPLRLACPKCRRGTFGNAPTVAGVRKTGLVEGREYSTHGWSGHRGQVECLDCGLVREPASALVPSPADGADAETTAPAGSARSDTALAEEVSRALDRVLGRR